MNRNVAFVCLQEIAKLASHR